jgi:hypothetical protein
MEPDLLVLIRHVCHLAVDAQDFDVEPAEIAQLIGTALREDNGGKMPGLASAAILVSSYDAEELCDTRRSE